MHIQYSCSGKRGKINGNKEWDTDVCFPQPPPLTVSCFLYPFFPFWGLSAQLPSRISFFPFLHVHIYKMDKKKGGHQVCCVGGGGERIKGCWNNWWTVWPPGAARHGEMFITIISSISEATTPDPATWPAFQ